MDREKRIRTAAAELMHARVTHIWKTYALHYVDGKAVPDLSLHWPDGDELKVFERLLDEVRSETLHDVRSACYDLLEGQHVKTTKEEVYNELYRTVFKEIGIPALVNKERVNEKANEETSGHQVGDREVVNPAEELPAPAHRGERRRARR